VQLLFLITYLADIQHSDLYLKEFLCIIKNLYRQCGKNYNSITNFINFNYEYDLVLKNLEKFGSGFKLKNDPGKILPIIINIINSEN